MHAHAWDPRSLQVYCVGYTTRARVVYPTQYTSRMRTARAKQEVGADTRIIVKE